MEAGKNRSANGFKPIAEEFVEDDFLNSLCLLLGLLGVQVVDFVVALLGENFEVEHAEAALDSLEDRIGGEEEFNMFTDIPSHSFESVDCEEAGLTGSCNVKMYEVQLPVDSKEDGDGTRGGFLDVLFDFVAESFSLSVILAELQEVVVFKFDLVGLWLLPRFCWFWRRCPFLQSWYLIVLLILTIFRYK